MTAEKTTTAFGWRIYGLAVMALGTVSLALGDFDPGQPVPQGFPARTVLAYAVAALMVIAGAAILWRRTSAWAAAALTAYYALIVVLLMNGRILLAHHTQDGSYEVPAEQIAITAGALIIYATSAQLNPTLAARLTRLGQLAFGVCALQFGAAHFFYMNLTAPLIPRWLPPSQVFWGYATGVGFLAAGLSLLTGVKARLAAVLLTAMLAIFTVMVHLPILIAAPSIHFNWTELTANLAILAAAWVVADSLARPRPLDNQTSPQIHANSQ
jgi:uncharacterized membrane protein YphA (DoxX/SURF4 family)